MQYLISGGMGRLVLLIGLFTFLPQAYARAVFAHFMVGNTERYEVSDWKHDITLAQEAHIDAFALNMAHNEATNERSVRNAFQAAESLGFQLFFSFDYAGNGPWPQSEVIAMLQKYSSSSAHYRYQGKPFVSTFEGPGNAEDWIAIKAATGCFFVPDWSSLGAKPALQLAGGVADGLFSWAAWPTGLGRMNTYVDASYIQYLEESGKPYMMPASPWFYTNMPGYDKNWLWHSDSLWYDRWVEIAYLQPEWVEIISWNDYGESHYIGPLNDKAYVAFLTGRAPYNYVLDMPHDGWRTQLPYLIDLYKTGTSSVTKENLVVWYRTNPRTTCSGGGTTGNTASQLQIEYDAYTLVDDKVFFSALLGSNATITVSIGGLEYDGRWEFEPDGGVGIYHGSFPFNLHLIGEVIVTISRNSKDVLTVKGKAISDTCVSGLANFNPWVGSATAGSTIKAVSPKLKLSEQTCIKGSGAGNFAGLCQFTCKYGYCPVGACYCTAMGAEKKKPKATGKKGYPKNGDANYGGLCSFACNLGYCPESACSDTPSPPYIPPSSPFAARACTGGESEHGEKYAGLCSFACAYGYCPISTCWCATVGDLNVPPPPSDVKGVPDTSDADEYELLKGLCNFACSRDYCPPGACRLASEGDDEYDDDDGDDDRPTEIIVDGSIWQDANPAVSCGSDCILVLPPVTLPSPTVITFDNDQGGYQTTLNVAWEVPVTTTLPDGQVVTTSSISHILQETRISVPPTTVSVLPLWPVTITSPTPTTTIYPMYRIPPQTIVITDDPNPLSEEGVSHPPVTRDITIPPYPWVSESARDTKIPPVTFTSASDSSNGPKCTNRARCGSGCHSRSFCGDGPCLIGCGGGGFAASNDPKPLPNPHPGPSHNKNDDPEDDDDDSQTCTTTATVTDVWVSCSTINPSSTSCTTTSSHVHTGCRATASATTTGVSDTCLLNSRDEDQGSDGGAGSGLITTIDDRKSTATSATKTTATPKPIPTRSVQQGVLTCRSDIDNYPQGDSRYYATLTDISTAAQQMCEGLFTDFNDGVQFTSVKGIGERNTWSLVMQYTKGSGCPAAPNFKAKKHQAAIDTCTENLNVIINNCDVAANGHDYWKRGGKFVRD
ncbi:hypothetical protein ABOM_000547, partial [Aspergillus bombycis]